MLYLMYVTPHKPYSDFFNEKESIMSELFTKDHELSLEHSMIVLHGVLADDSMEGILSNILVKVKKTLGIKATELDSGLLDRATVRTFNQQMHATRVAIDNMEYDKYKTRMVTVPPGFDGDLYEYHNGLADRLGEQQDELMAGLESFRLLVSEATSSLSMDNIIKGNQLEVLTLQHTWINKLHDKHFGNKTVELISLGSVVKDTDDLTSLFSSAVNKNINDKSVAKVSDLADSLSGALDVFIGGLTDTNEKDKTTMRDLGDLAYGYATNVESYASNVNMYKTVLRTIVDLQQTIVDDGKEV